MCIQVLHVNRLAEPDLLALANSPARLVFRLYEHPSIVERFRHDGVRTTATDPPDIHVIVDRIAAIGSIDANKVTWLICSAVSINRSKSISRLSAVIENNRNRDFLHKNPIFFSRFLLKCSWPQVLKTEQHCLYMSAYHSSV